RQPEPVAGPGQEHGREHQPDDEQQELHRDSVPEPVVGSCTQGPESRSHSPTRAPRARLAEPESPPPRRVAVLHGRVAVSVPASRGPSACESGSRCAGVAVSPPGVDVRAVSADDSPASKARLACTQRATRRHSGRDSPALRARLAGTQGATRRHSGRDSPALRARLACTQGATRRHSGRDSPALRARLARTQGATRGGGVHRSVTVTPTFASRRRTRGRLMPITLDGSPSIPSTNQPPSPSRVNAPATASGSPVAR